jgi:hypothetical protein
MNKQHVDLSPLLTAKEAGVLLKVSLSWLAKARMRGDGPPYICVGRSIRYAEAALIQWMKSRQRLSTCQQYGRGIGELGRNEYPSKYISIHERE